MKGRLISVSRVDESSILAFSAASPEALHRHLVLGQIDALIF
jgi:hypothetical protein